tara:strand:+ start:238 stop:603 length:366 start_codon:yes stop_codon:yes gene_type:complete
MDQLQTLMFQWTKLDKELKDVNKQASNIRKQKDELHKKLCPIIQQNNLQDNMFSIPTLETNVMLKEQKVSESISFKFLEDKLNTYFETQDECLQLIQYLKDNRKKETSFVLKSSEIVPDDE